MTARHAVVSPARDTNAGPARFGTADSRTRKAPPSRHSDAPVYPFRLAWVMAYDVSPEGVVQTTGTS